MMPGDFVQPITITITVRFEKPCVSGGESPSSLAGNRWSSEPKVMNGKV